MGQALRTWVPHDSPTRRGHEKRRMHHTVTRVLVRCVQGTEVKGRDSIWSVFRGGLRRV